MRYKLLLVLLFFIVNLQVSWSQFVIDTTNAPDHLVEAILLGQGVLVGNVQYHGAPHAIAKFEDFSGVTAIKKGIILTSGSAFYLKGPNRSTFKGWASGTLGDADLNNITAGKTFDAAVLEFDFVTTSENLTFRYVFGSEEYQEYVGSKYNDVFAFFINGPGLNDVNLARIPETEIPITINNVNHKKNRRYYRDNDFKSNYDRFIWDERTGKVIENKYFGKNKNLPKYDIQYDGFTVLLTASCKVIPGKIYHIKLAIADVSDGILDSGVLLEGGSFQSFGEKVVKLKNPFKNNNVLPQLIASREKSGMLEYKENEVPVVSIKPEFEPEIVYFEFDSYYTRQHYSQQLNKIADRYKNKKLLLELRGHTDSIGSTDYNIELSRRRAESVKEELILLGLANEDIVVRFFGETQPLQSNVQAAGRAQNRRVEVIFKAKQISVNKSSRTSELNKATSGKVY
jgi:outer membrane protein OmpA-like peptidoglycan-associated protein